MAELHARLHQLPPDGFPDADDDFLGRSLNEIRRASWPMASKGCGRDSTGSSRTARTGPAPRGPCTSTGTPSTSCIRGPAFPPLDWTESDVGDRHADVATTLMTVLCHPAPAPAWQRPFVSAARGMLARNYLRAYRRRLPLDETRLTYYGAWAALRRLARYGRWLSVGPGSTGCKPSALRHVCPAHCEMLCNYFARSSGVGVKLDCEGW